MMETMPQCEKVLIASTIRERLENRKKNYEESLQNINEALNALDQYPGMEEAVEKIKNTGVLWVL